MLLLKHIEGIFYRTYYEFINEFFIILQSQATQIFKDLK